MDVSRTWRLKLIPEILSRICFLKASPFIYVSRRCFCPTHDRTENSTLVLLFSPWFGFYSHHLSVARLKASLVSKGGDERRMTWLCSLPKRSFWETNQGMSVRREKYLQRRGEHWHSLLTDFPLSSHFHLTTCLRSDVKAARCVFDCLCLCGAVCVCLCVGWVGLLLLSVWCCSLLRCVLPIMNLSDNLSRSPPLLKVSLENRYWSSLTLLRFRDP